MITAKLEDIPANAKAEKLNMLLQRNQDAIWNRLSNLEGRLKKLENQGA